MFESLKKKLSRTSDKLEEEIMEEAKEEDNIKKESGKRRSFFSFGRRKKSDDDKSDSTESDDESKTEEDKKETKSRFWSRNKSEDDSDDAESEDDSKDDSDDGSDKKSHFWSWGKSEDDSDDGESVGDDEGVESEDDSKDDSDDGSDKKSHFWSWGKSEDDSDDGESVGDDDAESEDDSDDGSDKKSHFWSRSKSEDDSDDGESSGGIFSFLREKTISEKHVEDTLWELEMGLLEGDVAMEVASAVVDSVKDDLVGRKIKRSSDITEYTFNALRNAVGEIIDIPGKSMTEMIEEKKAQGEPLVVMFVGINGTGKTTTIGKLANYYLNMGYTPVIAASDTFRAGAIEQVTHHADNVGVKIIKHQKGSDPAAVAYDAVEHARAQGKELVLIDTAGRMQTNTNLMDEMKKIKRVAKPDLVIFVGDALTGNDATQQAIKFNEAIDVDGVILTKADADSKGGASLSIGYVIKKPIMFLGMGQGYDDIKEYDAEWMLDQLFSEDEAVAEEQT